MAEASSKEKQPPGAPGQRGRGSSGARFGDHGVNLEEYCVRRSMSERNFNMRKL
jgi:hypothetical protein